MSIFNALTTAVSGINAQSTAFTNLSNNIANSQTVGYKASETSFQDFVSNSVASTKGQAVSQGVGAVTTTATQQQGTISTSTNPLAVAISGNGFFNVSEPSSQATSGELTFSGQQYYTRNGNFYQDKNGYLVNTSGYYLEGYQVDPQTGKLDNTLTQIQASDVVFRPTATTTLSTDGALSTSASNPQTATIYDSQGNSHTLDINWGKAQATADGYTATVSFSSGDSTPPPSTSTMSMSTDNTDSYTVAFDTDGNITSVTDSSGNVVAGGYSGLSAALPINVEFTETSGSPALTTTQPISFDIGTIGSSAGVTVATNGTSANTLSTPVSDSVTSGTYSGLEMESDGSIMATFTNGDTQLVGKIALSSFANADGLMAVNGQAYVATSESGSPTTGVVGANGTGSLETSSTESSTTDLTSDLSSMIVAQEAYTANTKVVTTADTLLQATIAMIR